MRRHQCNASPALRDYPGRRHCRDLWGAASVREPTSSSFFSIAPLSIVTLNHKKAGVQRNWWDFWKRRWQE
jgi:hypothetical protein